MKKFLILILTLTYLASTSGATVYMHYCMGKMVDQSLWHNQKKQCSNCGMDKTENGDNNGCCKDENKQVKLDADHQLTLSAFDYLQTVAISESVCFLGTLSVNISSIAEENPTTNAPPRSCGVAIYKRNGVFRI